MLTLKTGWAGVTQGGVKSLSIIPDLQIVKEGETGCRTRWEWLDSTLGLEEAPETLHHGIVIAITAPTPADGESVLSESGQVTIAGVLASLVGMMQQSPVWLPLNKGHPQCCFNQILAHGVSPGPAHQAA